jgi:hypothetical protein
LAAVLIGAPVMCVADKTSSDVPSKAAATHGALGPAEMLNGKIVMVDPKSSLVVIRNSQGTTFDLVVTKATRLQSAEKTVQLKDLNTDINRSVSVTFIPERSRDIARSIKLLS